MLGLLGKSLKIHWEKLDFMFSTETWQNDNHNATEKPFCVPMQCCHMGTSTLLNMWTLTELLLLCNISNDPQHSTHNKGPILDCKVNILLGLCCVMFLFPILTVFHLIFASQLNAKRRKMSHWWRHLHTLHSFIHTPAMPSASVNDILIISSLKP